MLDLPVHGEDAPFWLRRLSAAMQDRAGIPFAHVRSNLRHESDETTRVYGHANDKERANFIARLNWESRPGVWK
ncbi:MAG: hypothetical protein CMF50_04550 [Legionellales bacterium]|nr:hypothetical protein [Legionellales bacterium]